MSSDILILVLDQDQRSDGVVLILDKVGIIQKRLKKRSNRRTNLEPTNRLDMIKSVGDYLNAISIWCPKPGVVAKKSSITII